MICQAVSPVFFYLRGMKDSSVSLEIPNQFTKCYVNTMCNLHKTTYDPAEVSHLSFILITNTPLDMTVW